MNKMTIVIAASMAALNVLAECPKEAAQGACPKEEEKACACAPCKCAPCACPKEAQPSAARQPKAAASPEAMAAEYESYVRKGVEQGRCTEAKAKEMVESYRALSPEWQKVKLENARRSVAAEEAARATIQRVENKVDNAIDAGKKREAKDSARAPQL